jgi:hypothetical protein
VIQPSKSAMNLKSLSFALLAMSIVFASCKKGDTINPTTIIQSAPVEKEGYIKATVSGQMIDTTSYSYAIMNTGIGNNNFYYVNTTDNCTSTYKANSLTSATITIKKAYADDGETFEEGFIYLTFDVSSLSDLSNPINSLLDIHFTKKLSNTNLFNFIPLNDGSRNYYGANTKYSNLKYDFHTGILTGNFSMVPQSSDTFVHYRSLTITNGSFSSKLVKILD